ncbi:ATP-dependent protease ATPase subunit ClpY, putative [Plasmodium relictum]|uniref:ATP-dependent protease ATPase subunit ClpY, putative n=1 Tax=Plasmodium relictum TaxID=85471 RepID=A0A1J1H2X5_PLARL|nr:ATP-dependent protease ATPase subunit ClpY, putative [Plasmodium relictum]CRG99284.1 ATP-dependent protease ATPase subunit ClpY, putative [Plasmodium relictum]
MKNFDTRKFIKLFSILNKKKKYPYFNLRYLKNIKNGKVGYDIMSNYINANKGKILNDTIKYRYENVLTKLITNINEFNKSINKIDNENMIFPRNNIGHKNNFGINKKNHDLLIQITYKNSENTNMIKNSNKKNDIKNDNNKNSKLMIMENYNKKKVKNKPDKFLNKDELKKVCSFEKKKKYTLNEYKEGKTDKTDDQGEKYGNILKEVNHDNLNLENKTNEYEKETLNNINNNNNIKNEEINNLGTSEVNYNEEISLCNENVNDNVNCSKVKITKENIINIDEIKKESKKGKNPKKLLVEEDNIGSNEKNLKENMINEENIKEINEKEELKTKKQDNTKKGSDNTINFQMKNLKSNKKCLYPHEIVEYLNKYIIGQTEAKKVVANALRQRWRRIQVDEDMKKDIIPKNILMIGPTGVGKTEIARRISMFVDAPFIKVEATKFTEVGFHGKDVDQIIKDLVEIAVKRQKTKFEIEIREQAEETVENIILYSLLGNIKEEEKNIWRQYLRDGSLDDKVISIDIPNYINNNIFSNDSVENAVKEALSNHQNIKSVKIIHQNINKQSDKKTMTIREAKQKLLQLEIDSSMNQEIILKTAINSVEEEGIVFIDEIDKICSKSNSSYNGPDASAEGVQRDLLPLIEGCVINTKYGNINTNYILFIASGAFQRVKPNDMLNELQGRLPVHVTLSSLTIKDFIEILTKTHNNLIQQNIALLKTEGIDLQFTEDAIETIANAAHDMNFYVENIGVRRLHTIIEKIMEDINYDVYNYVNQTVVIDKEKVKKSLEGFIKQYDLKKYII